MWALSGSNADSRKLTAPPKQNALLMRRFAATTQCSAAARPSTLALGASYRPLRQTRQCVNPCPSQTMTASNAEARKLPAPRKQTALLRRTSAAKTKIKAAARVIVCVTWIAVITVAPSSLAKAASASMLPPPSTLSFARAYNGTVDATRARERTAGVLPLNAVLRSLPHHSHCHCTTVGITSATSTRCCKALPTCHYSATGQWLTTRRDMMSL